MTSSGLTLRKHILWFVSAFQKSRPRWNQGKVFTYMHIYIYIWTLMLPWMEIGHGPARKPLLKAAHTPDWVKAKRIPRAATISITLDRFLRKGSWRKHCPLGSWVSYSSWNKRIVSSAEEMLPGRPSKCLKRRAWLFWMLRTMDEFYS